ncbi:putative ribonuclease H-like domain-containing protein [Tanacetum coccineum]
MDVKSAFLYGKIEEEVYVCQPPGFEDPDFPDRVYNVEKALYGLHQALELGMKPCQHICWTMSFKEGKLTRPYSLKDTKVIFCWSKCMWMISSLVQQRKSYAMNLRRRMAYLLVKTASTLIETQKPLLKDKDGEEVDVHMYRYQVNLKVSHLHAVKRIFRDYAGESLDRKSTTGGKGKKSVRLMMEELCKNRQSDLAKTVNGEVQLQGLVDGKKIIITEGVDCLPNATIFEQLALIGPKTTALNEFSSTTASAIIRLATNQKFNFSKFIFESMVKNLDNVGKFLMYARFVQVFLDKQLEGMSNHNRIYVTPSHTKKIFGNMRRVGKGFSGRKTPLFPTMVVHNQEEMGEDEAVYKELDDSLVRAATTASSLEVEQDSGNIKTRSKATPNEAGSQGTTSGGNEIASLKRRARKLERRNRSRTHKLKRLYKVGLTAKVESSGEEESLGEDASKQGRINAIDADEDITLVSVQEDADKEMFDVDSLNDEVVFSEQEVAAKDLTVDEVTLAQALTTLKSVKPKVKGNVIEDTSVPVSAAIATIKVSIATTTTATIPTLRKGIAITKLESEKPMKKKVQISFDKEIALKLQAKIDEEEIIARIALKLQAEINEEEIISRVKEEKIDEANIAWDDIQAKVDADYQLAKRLQAEEQEQFIIKQKATLFKELLEQRRKHFAAKRAEEKMNKPPTKTQQKKTMITYLKNMEGWKHKDLKDKDFDSIKELFDKGTELEQEVTKKQKVDDVQETVEVDDVQETAEVDNDQEAAKIKELIEIIPDEEEVVIDDIPLAIKEDLETLWKLVKAKYGSTRPEEGYERVLWGDLKVMFEPHVEDTVWRNQQDYRVLDWKIYDSCGVHSLRMQHMHIHMLVEKRYPFTPATITDMLNKKLQCDHFSEMVYQLLKLLTKQLKN